MSEFQKTKVRHIEISQDDDGQRLDRWLKKNVPDIPYGLAQKLIRKGQFRVDGKRIKPDVKLQAGQKVRIPPVEFKIKGKKPKLSEEDTNFMRSLVIYDDGDVIAINKPYGLAVQGGTKVHRHIDGMLDALVGDDGVRPRLVHRLDKETSGVLLLARSGKVAKALGYAFRDRGIKKIYYALVMPTPEMREGSIKAPLIKAGGPNRERMVVDEKEGKFSLTDYVVLERASEKVAFVAFWPRTGRTHQIRVHTEIMGCPILGDNKYRGKHKEASSEEEVELLEGMDIVDRLHLHSARIICKHPIKNTILDIFAPLPKELKKSWKSFGFDSNYKHDPFEGND